ncbi:MAG: hypothetical protein KGH52_01915, partial [Candidatus Micrarchaeota archaeon]|nr:hypothetical protein [Candidatus Micrarchaeota archaeon]
HGVKEVMAKAGIPYYSMTDVFRLLRPAVKKLAPSLDVMNSIEEEFNRISVKSRVFANLKRPDQVNPIELHKSMAIKYSEELSNKKVKS